MTTPLRITQVSLHRFKAAFALENVPLRPFNVIIGRNGAGKSTLLEALQWIDTAVRHTTDVACDRYRGAKELVNKRNTSQPPNFRLGVRLENSNGAFGEYSCQIIEQDNLAKVDTENLQIGPAGSVGQSLLKNLDKVRQAPGGRVVVDDRLALGRLDELIPDEDLPITGQDIVGFWKNAVFLRLEPSDLALAAPLHRPSLAPLLDPVGSTLPALLRELDNDSRADLVEMLQSVLPDVQALRVSMPWADNRGDYALRERATDGQKGPLIPSWMLSEGTRRMTAIFALLAHRPGPSLLCIEEIENGLDPVSVRKVLNYLYSASNRGVQIILTTHSPWLLDEVDPEDVLVVRRDQGNTTYTRLQDDPAAQIPDPRVLPGGRYIYLLET